MGTKKDADDKAPVVIQDFRLISISLIPEEQLVDKNCVIHRVVDLSGKVIYDRAKEGPENVEPGDGTMTDEAIFDWMAKPFPKEDL